ncbi:endolytic transglycosylase MltG [candidate division WWE3 bacterium]|uniref:Endolytic murein transglycosylase n=1 Tax=candidate division WWE3 bacterium TaxID=2053526 RepID=A0A955LVD7_UNCKA|nr:endolytic transglycosylase MltG [candidate division WWE3 bacterium]
MKQKKLLIILLTLVFGAVLAVAALWAYYTHAINTPVGSGVVVESFIIEAGDTPTEVGEYLQSLNLIHSSQIFSVYLKLHPELAAGIQAGEYEVTGQESIIDMVAMFQNGATLAELRFIEGWRIEEMAMYLASVFGDDFAKSFLDESVGLEGYLFPDTYYVGVDITPTTLIGLMRDTYDEKVDELLSMTDLSPQQLAIFASIIEREIALSQDRKIVAGILIKRWQNGWPIGADATVQYAWASATCAALEQKCVWWQHAITQEMLDIDSVYNTRKYAGLPPGPISSTSLDSLQSVVSRVDSDYWYYLSDSDGTTHYARTLEEHNINIATYLW